jgi:hypothetical protein
VFRVLRSTFEPLVSIPYALSARDLRDGARRDFVGRFPLISEFKTGVARFSRANHVRLIVDKKILVFMIVVCPEGSVMGEESVYGF